MSAIMCKFRRLSGLLAALLVLTGAVVRSDPLPAGTTITLSGAPAPSATFIHGQLNDFEIFSRLGDPVFRGTLETRVLRANNLAGWMIFEYRIRNTDPTLKLGFVTHLIAEGYSGHTVFDAEYVSGAPGTVAPASATRSADGAEIDFLFLPDAINSGEESHYAYASDTSATCWASGGVVRIVHGNPSVTIEVPSVRPLRGFFPPHVSISSPAPFACVCDNTEIVGTASDPEGALTNYGLTFADNPSGSFTLIALETEQVVADPLAVWDTTGVSQGNKFVRLLANAACSRSSTFTTVMFVDQQFDSLTMRAPSEGNVYGGRICIDGTVADPCFDSYTVDYQRTPGGVWFPVDAGQPEYTSAVVNDPLATWDSRSPPVSDGDYTVRVVGMDSCAHVGAQSRRVTIDNTLATALISEPLNCACLNGLVEVVGTVEDANLRSWVLQYTGGDVNGWLTLASGDTNGVDDVLAEWDTTTLRPCDYTLRLTAIDRALVNCDDRHIREHLVSVEVGDCDASTFDFDVDDDGDVDLEDYRRFNEEFTGP